MVKKYPSYIIIHFCTALLLLVFFTDSVSSEISIPTCNKLLDGEDFTGHGLNWNEIKIRLSTNSSEHLKCADGEDETEFKILSLHKLAELREEMDRANASGKIELRAKVTYFTQDGSLAVIFKGKGDHHYFGKEEYCITNAKDKSMTIKYCKPSCKGNRPCIFKCCPYDETYNPVVSCESTESGVKWSPFVYNDVYQAKASNKSEFSPHYMYNLFTPKCPFNYADPYYSRENSMFDEGEKLKFKLLKDGSLAYLTVRRKWEKPENGLFCIDAIQGYHLRINSSGLESEQVVFTCANPKETSKQMSEAYLVSMYVASVFLLLTCIVYLLLWDKQNVQGWTIFSLVSSMFFWYIFMATAHLLGVVYGESSMEAVDLENPAKEEELLIESIGSPNQVNGGGYFCTINGILAHFFFLSTFTWLTTINFDLFLSFKSLSTMPGRSKGFKRFSTYAVLSWGLPLIVVMVGLVLDNQYPNRESLVVTPEYGKAYCFVAPWAQGEYVYYIITVLLVLNFIFVGSTFYFFYAAKKATGSVGSNSKKETFTLLAKLSVIMGVTWIFEVISWFETDDKDPTAWYWVVLDLYNVFQAVLIFIIFVCKRTVMLQLEQKYSIFKFIFVGCGCAHIFAYLSSTKSSTCTSATEASTSTGNTSHNRDSLNKTSVGLNKFENEINSNSNESDQEQRTPLLQSSFGKK